MPLEPAVDGPRREYPPCDDDKGDERDGGSNNDKDEILRHVRFL